MKEQTARVNCSDTGVLKRNFCNRGIEFNFYPEDKEKSIEAAIGSLTTHYRNHTIDGDRINDDSDFNIRKEDLNKAFVEKMLVDNVSKIRIS